MKQIANETDAVAQRPKGRSAAQACELRVLSGPQAGAVMPLSAGAAIDVGSLSAEGCHLALRDPRVGEQRLRLHVQDQRVHIELLAGAVDMAGQMLEAPCAMDWPAFIPLRMGDTIMAVGTPGSDRWGEVLAAADAAPDASRHAADPTSSPADTASSTSLEAAADLPAASSRSRRVPEAWLAMVGGFVTVAAAGLLMFSSILTSAEANPHTELQRLQALLRAPAYQGLHIVPGHQPPFQIRGAVLTLADRARLDRALAQANVAADIDVLVGEQITEAVRDVYRMNGVVAQASPPASLDQVGSVRLSTATTDLARLAQIEATARRDVKGLKSLHTENTPPARAADASPVPNDPGKRIASIVPGETAYIVTVDGTRYFVGAMLPSGYRLDAIHDSSVLLERDGKTLSLTF